MPEKKKQQLIYHMKISKGKFKKENMRLKIRHVRNMSLGANRLALEYLRSLCYSEKIFHSLLKGK